MAEVMNELSGSNGEVDDEHDSIKLNGDVCDDASSIAANSPSDQILDDESMPSKDDKCISSSYKSKIDGINNTDGVKVHHEQQNNGNAAVANGRLQLDASSYAEEDEEVEEEEEEEDDEDDDDNDSESIQNDKFDKSRPPVSANTTIASSVSKKPIPDLTSINSVTKNNNSDSINNDCDPLSMSVDGDSNCDSDSDKAESRLQSNSKGSSEVASLTIDDVSTSGASVATKDDSIVVNNRLSSLTITAVTENGAKVDDDVVATDLSSKRLNSTGGDEDDEANEDDEVISISSTPDKSGKKSSSKKPSMSIVNITPRRSSRNLNKQRSYAEKDGGEYENNSSSDGISVISASGGRKRATGSSGTGEDDEIEEITPTDPLADEQPHRLSAVASAGVGKVRGGNKTIVVSDTKGLVEFASNTKASRSNKKEPTLVIIDTNSILSGRGPIPVSQQGGSNSLLHSSASSAPIPVSLPINAGAFANATRGNNASSNAAFSVIPIGLPAQGMYSQFKNPPPQIKPIVVGPATTSVTPVPMVQSTTPNALSATTISNVQASQPANKQPPVILPSLTDDMFVVEAPSFIVPYVYEKPPMKSLKEHIEKIENDIKLMIAEEEARREQQEREEAKDSVNEKPAPSESEEKTAPGDDSAAPSDNKAATEDATPKESSTLADDSKRAEEKDAENQVTAKEAEKSTTSEEKKDADSTVEPMEVDEEQPATASKPPVTVPTAVEPDTSVKKMEIDQSPANAIKEIEKKITAGPTTGTDDPKKPASYFDNPLGKFFMQIGLNLVQEHVQTDLLRSQKRKRDKEGGKCSADVQSTIDELTKTLESSKENNDPFKLELKKCELCSFKTESLLVMAHHLETPHMKNYTYRCNFCTLEVRSPHDILFHMEAEHNIRGRLERAPAFHQCPNCPFEDNQKGKLTRHLISCSKKYRPERNQEPPLDWEPPAKIPRVTRNRPPSMSPGNAVYQAAMSGLKQAPQNTLLPKLLPNTTNMKHNMMNAANKRPNLVNQFVNRFPNAANAQSNFQQRPIPMQTPNQGMMFRPGGANTQTPVLLPQGYHLSGAQIYQTQNNKSQSSQPGLAAAKLLNQPSISITPLPRQTSGSNNTSSNNSKSGVGKAMNAVMAASNKAGGGNFVVCEICDGYIKDLEQLRNHMQWIHKVKIHPKMIYNRPPLNCQKCQERFFTDQGLERHLLGAHGLVTSSMQEAANKGKDGGRCPVCGRVYQWKLLNHVARDHQMALKPAHLSYKCTVCTATFGMYKQFESHVYSAHSVVAKRAMDSSKKPPPAPSSSQNDTLLKPLKINDEITIIPQPVRSTRPSNNNNRESNAATITKTVSNSKKMDCEDNGSNNSKKPDDNDDGDEQICKCACLMGNFANYEAFRTHLIGKHLKSFKIILSRLDLKSFNRLPNKENAFKLTKFDRNLISDQVRKQYNLDEFFIEIKRHRLSDDFKYKVVETKRPEPVDTFTAATSSQPDTENFVPPEVVFSAAEDSDEGAKAMKKPRLFKLNTVYQKRRIESELFARKKAQAGKVATAAASRKIAPKPGPGPAIVVNGGGKQKKLISRGRRNAARQNARKNATDSNEMDASSSDDDVVNVIDDDRRPSTTAYSSRSVPGSSSNSFNDHFMSGLSGFQTMISQQRTVTTSTSRGTGHISATRTQTPRYRLPSPSQAGAPFTVFNHQTVTTMSSTSIGARAPRPVGLSTAANRSGAPKVVQIFSQRSVKVTKSVTTYSGPGAAAARARAVAAAKPKTTAPAPVPSKPQAVISLLSDSDSDHSAVEIVDSDPGAVAAASPRKSGDDEDDNDNEEVFILPS